MAVGLSVFDTQLQRDIVRPFSLIELRDPKIVSEIDTMMSFQYFFQVAPVRTVETSASCFLAKDPGSLMKQGHG